MDHSIDLLLWLAYNDNQSLLCLPDRGWSQFQCSVETNAISSFSGESGTDSVWRFPRLCVRCAFNLQFYFYNQKRDFRMSRTFLERPESSEWCQEQMCGNAAVLSLVFLLLICSVVVAQCSACSLSWGQSVPVVRELPTFLPRRTLNCALGRCCSNNSISRWVPMYCSMQQTKWTGETERLNESELGKEQTKVVPGTITVRRSVYIVARRISTASSIGGIVCWLRNQLTL